MHNPWESNWRVLKPLESGGQGDTFLVEHISGTPQRAVLKRLKSTKASDLKARGRMFREVASLRTLVTAGAKVPQIFDDNTSSYEDLSVPLYFAMEYVDGRTLDLVLNEDGPMSLPTAIELTLDLCKSLRVAVKEEIVHRDIKPENLILRKASSVDLVVLDFGLSFNKEYSGTLTEFDEALDNKFVSLPERRGPYENKRDFRSDLTSVAAVLFYTLTGTAPRNLRDSTGKTPNRGLGIKFATVSNEQQLVYLHSFFDRGLNNDIELRFQNLDQLESRLRMVLSPPLTMPEDDFQTAAKHHVESLFRVDRINRFARYRKTLKPFDADVEKCVMELFRGIEGFRIWWSSETDRHNDAVTSSDVWIFKVKVGINGHRIEQAIVYRIREGAAECVLSRRVTIEDPPYAEAEVEEEADLFHYLPSNNPDASILISDLKVSVLKAMEGLNRQVDKKESELQSLGGVLKKAATAQESKEFFKKMKEAAGAKSKPKGR